MTLIEKAEGKTVCTLIPSIMSDNTGMIQVLNLAVSLFVSRMNKKMLINHIRKTVCAFAFCSLCQHASLKFQTELSVTD